MEGRCLDVLDSFLDRSIFNLCSILFLLLPSIERKILLLDQSFVSDSMRKEDRYWRKWFEFVEEIIVDCIEDNRTIFEKIESNSLSISPLILTPKEILVKSSSHDRALHPDPNHIDRSSLVNAKRDRIKRGMDTMEFDCSNRDQRDPFYLQLK